MGLEHKIITVITICVGILFLLSVGFDVGVTLMNVKIHSDFTSREANPLFRWEEKNNIYFFARPSIMVNEFLLVGLIVFYERYKKYPNTFISFLCGIIVVTIGHFVGGFSWLYSSP